MLVNNSLQMHKVNTLLHHHHSMEQSPSLEAKRSSGNHETPHIQNSLPSVSILRYINSVHATPSHYLKIKFNIILLLHLDLPTKILYASLLPHKHAKFLAQLILLDLITHIILGEEYRSYSSTTMYSSSLPCYSIPILYSMV